MSRTEALEKVLAAAQAVLDARNDQMLTRVEWEALAAAVTDIPSATLVQSQPKKRLAVQFVFEEGLMLIWDEAGNGLDCHELRTEAAAEAFYIVARLEAERQIDRWASEYDFDVVAVKKELADYICQL
jgi:hypothetical protein